MGVVSESYQYGAGRIYYRRPGILTPVQVGWVTGISVDISREVKELRVGKADPIAFGQGARKIGIKTKMGGINVRTLAHAMGGTVTSGRRSLRTIAGSVPAETPFTVAVANYYEDGGVWDVTLDDYLTAVAASPSTGQYVPGATYLFAAADAGHPVRITARVTDTTGFTASFPNTDNAISPTLSLVCGTEEQGAVFYAVVCGKFGIDGPKTDDFTGYDLEFSAGQDENGNTFDMWGDK